MMHPLDSALQSTLPTVMVPKFGQFDRLDQPGNRILAGCNGFWIEVCRPGIYGRAHLANSGNVALPYGEVTPALELGFRGLGKHLATFLEMAKQACPKEVGMALVWDEAREAVYPVPLKAISSSEGHIHYHYPDLSDGQHVVLDIHSHGKAKAYFSRTDNKDDRGDIKIAVVVGNVNHQPTVKARFCALGSYFPLSLSLEGIDGRNKTEIHLDETPSR